MYDTSKKSGVNPSNAFALSPSLFFIVLYPSSLDTNSIVFIPSIFPRSSLSFAICSSVASGYINTCIPCSFSKSLIALFIFCPITKNSPNISIVAHITPKQENVDFLFLNTFLKPSDKKYPITLYFTCYTHLFYHL